MHDALIMHVSQSSSPAPLTDARMTFWRPGLKPAGSRWASRFIEIDVASGLRLATDCQHHPICRTRSPCHTRPAWRGRLVISAIKCFRSTWLIWT